jgi:hypothetical protein
LGVRIVTPQESGRLTAALEIVDQSMIWQRIDENS